MLVQITWETRRSGFHAWLYQTMIEEPTLLPQSYLRRLHSQTDSPFRGVKTDSTGSNVSISFYCAYVYFACTYASEPLECLMPVGVRRRYQTPPNWNFKQLCAAVWALRTEPESSGRAANAAKCWAISTNLPGETFFFLFLFQSVQRDSQG